MNAHAPLRRAHAACTVAMLLLCSIVAVTIQVDRTALASELPSPIVPVVPARLLETRSGLSTVDGLFNGVGRQAAGATIELTVAGRGGVPVDAAAVLLNVTAVFPDGPGFATVWPCGTSRPDASNLNYSAGQVVPNAVLAKIGVGGKVCIFTLAGADVLADVNGYVPAGGAVGTVVPARLLETRSGLSTVDGLFNGVGRQAAGATIELTVAGRGGVPVDAAAVLLNVTAVFPDGPGFATVWPCGTSRPDGVESELLGGAGGAECCAREDRCGWQGVHLHACWC